MVATMLTPRRFLVSLSLFSLISLSLFPRSLLSILSFCPSPLSFSFFLSLAYLLRLGVKIRRPALWHSCGGDIGGNDVDPAPISGLTFSFLFDLSLFFLILSFLLFFLSFFLSLSSVSFFFLSFALFTSKAGREDSEDVTPGFVAQLRR